MLRDILYGVRLAVRHPRPAVLAALTLALGLGAATALFTLTNAWLLRPLPFPDADRLVSVWETIPAQDIFENTPAPAVLSDWRARAHGVSAFGAMTLQSANLTGTGEPEKLGGISAEPALVQLLGIRPLLGRTFSDDVRAGDEVMLTYSFWQRRFAGSRDVLGTTLTLDGRPTVVIGVLPRGLSLLGLDADVWRPLRFTAEERASRNRYLWVFGRLRDGVPVDRASAELDGISKGNSHGDLGARAVSLQAQTVGSLSHDLPILFGATAVLLLIACANVASFLLARASARRGEFAIRASLGAGRWRIVRQVVSEALPVAFAGGGCGLLLSSWLVVGFQNLLPQAATLTPVTLGDPRIIAFGCAASLLTAVLFSAAPALLLASKNTVAGMREAGRGVAGRQITLRVLACVEVALAVALLVAAGVVGRSYLRLTHVDLGFRTEHVVTFEVPRADPGAAREESAFFDELLTRLRDAPGIEHAGVTQALPLKSFGYGSSFVVEGVPGDRGRVLAHWRSVSPGFIEALGMRMREGRAFDARDRTGAERVAIVSASYAASAFPNGASPIGHRIGWATLDKPMTIVGVVEDIRLSPTVPPDPHVYMPYTQVAGYLPIDLAVRARDGVTDAQVIDTVRRAVWAIDPLQPVAKVRTMGTLLWELLDRRRFTLALWAGFAFAAALLALLGVYGVVSYVVRQATKELGIRIALGARPSSVIGLVLRQGSTIALVGAAAGVLLAYWTASLVRGFLIAIDPRDPLTYALVVTIVIAGALLACVLPARRAARVDPLTAIRAE